MKLTKFHVSMRKCEILTDSRTVLAVERDEPRHRRRRSPHPEGTPAQSAILRIPAKPLSQLPSRPTGSLSARIPVSASPVLPWSPLTCLLRPRQRLDVPSAAPPPARSSRCTPRPPLVLRPIHVSPRRGVADRMRVHAAPYVVVAFDGQLEREALGPATSVTCMRAQRVPIEMHRERWVITANGSGESAEQSCRQLRTGEYRLAGPDRRD
jgi:hypothetical protein